MSETGEAPTDLPDDASELAAAGSEKSAADTPSGEGLLVAIQTAGGWVLGRPLAEYEQGKPWEVKYDDGSVRTYSRGPANLTKVTPGTLLHRVATEPEAIRQRMAESPADVLVELLRETGDRMNKQALEAKLGDLRLLPEGKWWPAASKDLKLHPHVAVEGGKYRYTDRPA